MPVFDITKDPEALTMTVIAEFAAPPEWVWRLYSEGDQLQRWWGPPGWPATFLRHELAEGGGSHYFMEGPDGTRYHGVWSVVDVDAPRAFVIRDAFADENGTPNEEMGWSTMAFEVSPSDAGSRVTMVSTFASPAQFAQQLEMGMEDGLRAAANQIDGILAEDAAA